MSGDEMTREEENILTEQIVDVLWGIWRSWRALSHPVRQGQITPEQYWILRLLHHYGPLRIKDIAGRTGTGSSSVTIAVKRLERDGVVLRRRDNEADERVVTVHLTEKGQALFRSWRQARRRALTEIFAPLNDREKRQLYALLTRVNGRPGAGGITQNKTQPEDTAGATGSTGPTGPAGAIRSGEISGKEATGADGTVFVDVADRTALSRPGK